MAENKGLIFNIQKFCVNDGPGIRTVVFFKGCPLNCLWCHNPESKENYPEISYTAENCIGCGSCVENCRLKCHSITDGVHIYDRRDCIRCGVCTKHCPGALEVIGKKISVKEIMDEVLRDKLFYDNSNGGITLSGGEPMIQFEFIYALLKESKANGLNTCLETCGFAPTVNFEKIINYVDIFLYDYKETNPVLHKKYTGYDNEIILKNLFYIDGMGGKIILRAPIIPGYNDRADHFEGIARTAESLKNILEINVEPYHPLGKSKCGNIGKIYPLENYRFTDDDIVLRWIKDIQSGTEVTVKKG